MDYNSVSSIVLLALVVIGILGWLPRRTFKSMDKVAEHRRDRFSPSLHLIKADDAKRFSDGRITVLKGVSMKQVGDRSATLSRGRISEIRRMRREAAARRRILVLVLLVGVVAVLVAAFTLDFSPFYALIPTVLLLTVLALGARASRHARAWEQRIALAAANENTAEPHKRGTVSVRHEALGRPPAGSSKKKPTHEPHASSAPSSETPSAPPAELESAPESVDRSTHDLETPTHEMERREIRRALHDASEHDKTRSRAHKPKSSTQPALPAHKEESTSTNNKAGDGKSSSHHAAKEQPAVSNVASYEVHSDSTTQLSRVKAARALDAFDLAAAQPELISFSLDGSRGSQGEQNHSPQSLEIKSMRQVAKAVPEQSAEHLEEEMPKSDASQAHDAVDDVQAFHDDEQQSDVDVPKATDDSLGTSIASILARRVAR